MQMNVLLNAEFSEEAERIRRRYFPGATSQQIRDSYLLNLCIENFDDTAEVEALLPYFAQDNSRKTQKMITLQAGSFEKLRRLALRLNRSNASTLRALIAYRVDHLEEGNTAEKMAPEVGSKQFLTKEIHILEKQLKIACQTLEKIQRYIEKEEE